MEGGERATAARRWRRVVGGSRSSNGPAASAPSHVLSIALSVPRRAYGRLLRSSRRSGHSQRDGPERLEASSMNR